MRVTCGQDTEVSGALLATPVGELEVHGATHLWEAVAPRLKADTPSLLIDMGGVEWMSSAGVGTLIRLVSRVEQLGGKLALFGCNAKVRQVLQITALEKVLNTSESHEEASRALS